MKRGQAKNSGRNSGQSLACRLLDAIGSTMVSRKSSITNAFVNAILPNIQPAPRKSNKHYRSSKMEPTDVRCSYCRNKATEWDHLRPIVINLRPTGYISEIANLVPSFPNAIKASGTPFGKIGC